MKIKITYDQLRFDLNDPNYTEVYVHVKLSAENQAEKIPEGVEGWHHQTFPSSISVVEIVTAFGREEHPVQWPRKDPPGQPAAAIDCAPPASTLH